MTQAAGKGIKVLITGDYSEFQKALGAVRRESKEAGEAIFKALNGGGMSASAAEKNLSSLARNMMWAHKNALTMNQSFAAADAELKKVAAAAGLADDKLGKLSKFESLGRQMFKKLGADQLEKNFKNIQSLTGASALEMARLRMSVGDATGALRLMGAEAANSFSRLANLRNVIMAGAAGYALRDVTQTAMKFDTYQRSFNAISGSAAGGADEMAFVRAEAKRLGQDLFALADSYRGLSAAAMTSGLSQAQVRDVFSAVGEAATTLGLTSEQSKYALYALQQMMSKGVVTMEELRRQLGDALPGAFSAAARAMNVTERELIKMVESGQLMSRDFLPKYATELRRTFGAGFFEASQAAARQFTRLGNEIKEAKNAFGMGFLEEAAAGAASFVDTLERSRGAIQTFGQGVGFLTRHVDLLTIAFGVRSVVGIIRWVKEIGTAAGATTALSAAGKGLLSVLGGVGGLGFTAAAAGIWTLYQRTEETREAMERLTAKYSEASKTIGKTANEAARLRKIEIQQELDALQKDAEKIKRIFDLAEHKAERSVYLLKSSDMAVNQILVNFRDGTIKAEDALKQLDATAKEFGSSPYLRKAEQAIINYHNVLIETRGAKKRLAEATADVAKATGNLVGPANDAADAFRDLKAAMAGIGGADFGDSAEAAMAFLRDVTKNARSAAKAADDQRKANIEAAKAVVFNRTLEARFSMDEEAIKAAEQLNKELREQIVYLGEIERGEIGLENARKRGTRAAKEAEKALRSEAKAKEFLLELEKELASLTGQTTAAKLRELQKQIAHWEELARRIQDAAEQARAYALIAEIAALKTEELGEDAESGLKRAAKAWVETNTAARAAENVLNRTADAMTDAFADIVQGTKSVSEAFGNMANVIAAELTRAAIQMAIVRPLMQGFMGFMGWGGVAAGAAGAASGGNPNMTPMVAAVSSPVPKAKGDIFGDSILSAYRNTVVNQPTFFPFAKGIGLMGEAGAEAIMPLERDSRGRLGVSIADDYVPTAPSFQPVVNVKVINNGTPMAKPEVQTRRGADGSINIDVLLKTLEDGMSNRVKTGQSRFAPTMEELYGISSNRRRRLRS